MSAEDRCLVCGGRGGQHQMSCYPHNRAAAEARQRLVAQLEADEEDGAVEKDQIAQWLERQAHEDEGDPPDDVDLTIGVLVVALARAALKVEGPARAALEALADELRDEEVEP